MTSPNKTIVFAREIAKKNSSLSKLFSPSAQSDPRYPMTPQPTTYILTKPYMVTVLSGQGSADIILPIDTLLIIDGPDVLVEDVRGVLVKTINIPADLIKHMEEDSPLASAFPDWAWQRAWSITRHDDSCECEDECSEIAGALSEAWDEGFIKGVEDDPAM